MLHSPWLLGGVVAALCVSVNAMAADVDLTRDGVYQEGRWEYRITITARGSRSEGVRGELRYDAQPLPTPAVGDYYLTPWGELTWVGDPEVLWGPHGWFARPVGASGGQRLVEPSLTPVPAPAPVTEPVPAPAPAPGATKSGCH